MNWMRQSEVKQGLGNMGLLYFLVISMVLALFFLKTVKKEIASSEKIPPSVENTAQSRYRSDI